MNTRNEHIGQRELAEMGIKVFNRQTQKYGFSFTVATELEAYKAAYKLQFRANETVVKSIKNEWAVEVYQ